MILVIIILLFCFCSRTSISPVRTENASKQSSNRVVLAFNLPVKTEKWLRVEMRSRNLCVLSWLRSSVRACDQFPRQRDLG